jgi:hypothetical protein
MKDTVTSALGFVIATTPASAYPAIAEPSSTAQTTKEHRKTLLGIILSNLPNVILDRLLTNTCVQTIIPAFRNIAIEFLVGTDRAIIVDFDIIKKIL